jgi:hypothetical protein
LHLGQNVPNPSGIQLKYLLMAKHSSTYIPLPMPPTTKDKFAIYLTIDGIVEMFLYDGKQAFTPDFPDIPIEKIDLRDGRTIRQETLARICRYMMTQQTVEYNKEFKFWEALPNEPF